MAIISFHTHLQGGKEFINQAKQKAGEATKLTSARGEQEQDRTDHQANRDKQTEEDQDVCRFTAHEVDVLVVKRRGLYKAEGEGEMSALGMILIGK